LSQGIVDVPDGTVGSTEIDIPMGSIGTALTAALIKNTSGQELDIEFLGTATPYSVPTGGLLLLAFPATPESIPITAVTVTTTGAQTGAGAVYYWLFGDPEVVGE
jgi:hypothetical protein